MRFFADIIIRFRVLILIVAGVLTAAFAWTLPKLWADDDVMQFLPGDDPEIKLFRRVNERFGGLDVAIIGLESGDMFTVERLEKVRRLTRKVAEVEGVFDVLSFTEVPDPRPSPFGLVVEPMMDRVPTDKAELADLKKRVLANKNAVGNLISRDGRAAMILCFLGGKRPPIHVASDIKNVASSIWTNQGIYYGGAPFIRLHVAGGTKKDLIRLTPVVALVVFIVTFLIFRKPLGVLLSLGVVGVALVWLMGMLSLRGKGVTVVGSALPTLLVAIGGAYGIHLLAAYFNGESQTVKERIKEMFQEVGAPVIASALTTCAGFLSFLAMDVAPMREFGASAALGVGFTAILALTVIPAVLSFGKKVPKSMRTALLSSPLGRFGGWAAAHRSKALAAACLVTVISLVFSIRIAPDSTLKTFFKDGSEPDKANKFLERHFGGSVYVQVYFEGDMRSPFVLAELRKVVEFAEGMDEVVQVGSIIDPITMMAEAMGGRADLPSNREKTQSLYPFLEGSAAIDQIVSSGKDASLVQIRFKNIPPDEVTLAVAKLTSFVKSEIPIGVKAIDVSKLDGVELAKRRAEMQREVAKRIIRLVIIHSNVGLARDATAKVISQLKRTDWDSPLAAGVDMEAAVASVVGEHIVGEAAPFEEPSLESLASAAFEWGDREKLAKAALNPVVLDKVTERNVEQALREALPITTSRDPEGLELTAAAVAEGLKRARASVRSKRMVTSVLAAAGVASPSDELKDRAAVALTDLDARLFGFPYQGEGAKRIIASVTGQPVINVAFCDSTVRNQLRSLAVALVVLTLILAFTFRSLLSAAKALVPAIVMLAMAVGIMGAAAIPLDLTTSMIAVIALGIGVDYAIHFLWRRRRRGESLARTTAHVGPSIASNAVQVAAGFAVMALSDMVPMQRFGLLVAMTMILSAVATFVLLPALRAEGTAPVSEEETEDSKTVADSTR